MVNGFLTFGSIISAGTPICSPGRESAHVMVLLIATRHVSHFAYGDGASAIAGSSNTCAPYNSFTAWLMTIFLTASGILGLVREFGCCFHG